MQTRKAFVTKDGQPFLVSGSGALGWDVVATNLISEGGKVRTNLALTATFPLVVCRVGWGLPKARAEGAPHLSAAGLKKIYVWICAYSTGAYRHIPFVLALVRVASARRRSG